MHNRDAVQARLALMAWLSRVDAVRDHRLLLACDGVAAVHNVRAATDVPAAHTLGWYHCYDYCALAEGEDQDDLRLRSPAPVISIRRNLTLSLTSPCGARPGSARHRGRIHQAASSVDSVDAHSQRSFTCSTPAGPGVLAGWRAHSIRSPANSSHSLARSTARSCLPITVHRWQHPCWHRMAAGRPRSAPRSSHQLGHKRDRSANTCWDLQREPDCAVR